MGLTACGIILYHILNGGWEFYTLISLLVISAVWALIYTLGPWGNNKPDGTIGGRWPIKSRVIFFYALSMVFIPGPV